MFSKIPFFFQSYLQIKKFPFYQDFQFYRMFCRKIVSKEQSFYCKGRFPTKQRKQSRDFKSHKVCSTHILGQKRFFKCSKTFRFIQFYYIHKKGLYMWDESLTFQAFTLLRTKFFLSDASKQKEEVQEKKSPKAQKTLQHVNTLWQLAKSENLGNSCPKKSNVGSSKLNLISSEKKSYQSSLQFSQSPKKTKAVIGEKYWGLDKEKINQDQKNSKDKNQFKTTRKGNLNVFLAKEKKKQSWGRINLPKNQYSTTPPTRESEKESQIISKGPSLPHTKISKNTSYWNKNIVLQEFTTLKKIGKGAFGEVHLVKHNKIGMIFALKIIDKEFLRKSKDEENLQREIQIQSMLNDSQLLRLYGVFSDEKNKYLIMEPMLGGSLWENKKKFKTFKEKHVSAIVLNLCEAVKSLHDKDILHRDIKLENILLMEGVAKLADFGCAVKSAFMRNSQIGSRNYLSPEQYHSRFYDKKVDIWSIGIVTYQLLFGVAPFEEELLNSYKKMGQLPSFQLKLPQSHEISQEAKDFIRKLLERNPNKRPNIQRVLRHSFLKKNTAQKAFDKF